MPQTHINPADAHLVNSAIKDARRQGVPFADILHDRDLLLTESRRKEIIAEEYNRFVRIFQDIRPEQILHWYFRSVLPVTNDRMHEATTAWLMHYIEGRTQ